MLILAFPVLFLGLFFMAGISLGLYALLLFAGALVPFLISKLLEHPLSYKNAYVISIFALAPILIIDTIGIIFGFGLPFITKALLFALLVLINLRKPSSLSVR